MKRKNFLALLVTLTLTAGIMAACSSGTSGSGESPSAAAPATSSEATAPASEATKPAEQPAAADSGSSVKDTWVVATENEPDSVTSAEHNATASSYINSLTYSGLFYQNESLDAVPNLVKEYEIISDTEIMMTLFEGILFHDGTELTAEDVKASLAYAKEFLEVEQFTQAVKDVEVIDKYNFKLVTNGPSSTLYFDLAHHGNAILPKALIDSGNDFNANPIGSGPYKFTNWTLGDELVFEVHEDYFDKARSSQIPNLIWRIIPEGSSRTIALETGEVDFIIEVATIDVDRLEANENVTLLQKTGVTHNYIMINNENPAFSNEKVRQALNAAVDRETIVQVATNGMATPVTSQAVIGFSGSSDENSIGYDPELAKQLMAESGVDPSTIEFSMICSNETKRRTAEVVQANLAEIGINAQIESMDLATYLAMTSDGLYTAAIGNYTTGDLVTYLKSVHASKQIGGSNRSRCNNPEIDALIEKCEVTVDPDERKVFEQECVALLNEYAPQIPIYQDAIIRAYNKDLQGIIVTGTGGIYFNELHWAQ